MIEATLPPGFCLRPATWDDLENAVEVLIACDLHDEGSTDIDAEGLRTEWQKPGLNLDTDVWVVVSPEGRIVGYEELWNRSEHTVLSGDGYVHPEYRGLGIGTALLRRLEQRAREHIALAPPDAEVLVRNGVSGRDPASHALHENEGYSIVRNYWRMRIDMQAPPPPPVWPAGLTPRTFQAGDDPHPVFDALHESFMDHWGYVPWVFENWKQRQMEVAEFDPSLWFLIMDGAEVAGGAICSYHTDIGWVGQLGVRKPWRRMGLGLQLLNQAFGEFYRRGTRTVALGVDASNTTGATRLYERAGMYVEQRYIVFEKKL